MKMVIECNPNAEPLKREIAEQLESLGHEISDFGSDEPIYANVVFDVAEAVVRGECDSGVVLCGTGIGAIIAANKAPGAYCALVTDIYQAERAALSNSANMIAMGQQVTGSVIARQMARVWVFNTPNFDHEGRSASKVQRIVD